MIVLAILAIAGCAVGAAGVFFPWLLESGDVVRSGLQTVDGMIALAVAVIAAGWIVYTTMTHQNRYWYVTAVAGFALSLIGYTTFFDLRTIVLSEGGGYVWGIGAGPFLMAGGGVVTLLSGCGVGVALYARGVAARRAGK